MAIFDKTGLLQKLVQKIRSNGIGGLTKAVDVREFLTDFIDTTFSLFGQSTSGDTDLEWSAEAIYNTTDNKFAIYNLRIYKSKIDGNQGNTPPTVANAAGNYEDDNWLEVSPAPASGITAWAAGVYGSGLKIIYHNKALYELIVPEASRPFESTDIDAEIVAEQWEAISGGNSAPAGKLRHDTYTALALASTIAWDVINVAEGKAKIVIPSGTAVTDIAFSLSNATDGFTGILAVYNNDTVSHNLNLPTAGIYAVSEGEAASNTLAAGAISEFNFAHDGTKIKVTRGAFVEI